MIAFVSPATPTVLIRSLADYGKHDLSRDPIIMTCNTPCMYPQADVDWYYSKVMYIVLHVRLQIIAASVNEKHYCYALLLKFNI